MFPKNSSLFHNIGYEVINWNFPLFNMLFDRLDCATLSFELECEFNLKLGFHIPL